LNDVYRPKFQAALYLINCGCGGDEEKARLLCDACSMGEIDIVKKLVERHKIDPNGNCMMCTPHNNYYVIYMINLETKPQMYI